MPRAGSAGVWRETSGRHTSAEFVTAHAVDGDTTLCGKSATVVPWRDTGRGQRCEECVATLVETPVTYREIHAAVPGLSYRVLDHWTIRGYLRAANPGCGSGRRRTWPPGEVEIARLMWVMVQAGVGPAGAERAARGGGVLSDSVRVVVAAGDLVLPGVGPEGRVGA